VICVLEHSIMRRRAYDAVKSARGRRLICAVLCHAALSQSTLAIEISSENETTVVNPGKVIKDDRVQIQDSKLDFYVRSVTGRRRPAELKAADVERIVELDLDGLGINSLAGLEHLKALRSLSLVSNMVSSLNGVATLLNLEALDLRHNRVENIEALRNLEQIKVLRLDHNLVQDLSPLVQNAGIGPRDRVTLKDNDLDCKKAKHPLEALRGRGVDVASDCE